MKQQGFVLITLMVILMVLTGLVVANMRWIVVDWRQYHHLLRLQKQRDQCEDIAEKLSTQIGMQRLQNCILGYQKDALLKFNVLHKGCPIGDHYWYGITDLGVFPCVKLSSKLSTHHWLLTIVDERRNHSFLQLRIASAESYHPCHHSRPIIVQPGILTRRWL